MDSTPCLSHSFGARVSVVSPLCKPWPEMRRRPWGISELLLLQAQGQWPETASERWQGLQGHGEDTSQNGQVEGLGPQSQRCDG